MRAAQRLRKLETRFERVVDAVSPIWSDPEWHALFAEKGREGFFRREPDFPRALAKYENAIAAAERIAPEIDPPRDFRIRHPRRIPQLFTWRNDPRFPDVGAGFEWLAALLVRVLDRMPPVTEAAFAELACWFHEHEPQLQVRCPATGQLDLGDGGAIRLSDLAFDLKAGPRRVESGRVAAAWSALTEPNCLAILALVDSAPAIACKPPTPAGFPPPHSSQRTCDLCRNQIALKIIRKRIGEVRMTRCQFDRSRHPASVARGRVFTCYDVGQARAIHARALEAWASQQVVRQDQLHPFLALACW